MSGRVRGDLERLLIQGKEEDDGLVVTHDRPDGETIVSGAGEDALVGHIGDAEVPHDAPVEPYPQIVTVPDRRGVEVSMVPHDAPVEPYPQIVTRPVFLTDWRNSCLREIEHFNPFDPDLIDIPIVSLAPVVRLDEYGDLMEEYDSEQLRKYYPYASSSGTFATDASLIRPQGGGTGKSYGVKFGERFDFKKWFK